MVSRMDVTRITPVDMTNMDITQDNMINQTDDINDLSVNDIFRTTQIMKTVHELARVGDDEDADTIERQLSK